ncbi:MAG: methyl-accepting chemotaxis protein, partial [Fretibacterium sp.]|nr:methyl-accepting chemotaxis protein [Fretibacterium sp.]
MKIRQLLRITGVAVLIFALLSLTGVLLLNDAQERERKAYEEQLEFVQLATTLNEASNYLTDEARYYVQTGDKVHFD